MVSNDTREAWGLSRGSSPLCPSHQNELLRGLALTIVFLVRWVITAETKLMMLPAGSSGKPLLDLNLPPTEEPDPASTSDPQEGVEPGPIPLSEVERKTLARLVGYAPEARLLEEARAIIRLKGAITDRMFELDREAPDFLEKAQGCYYSGVHSDKSTKGIQLAQID